MINKTCIICKNSFSVPKSRGATAKYCSRACLNDSKKLLVGKKNHFYGKKHTKEAIQQNRMKALQRCKDEKYRLILSENGRKTMLKPGQASKMGKLTHHLHPNQAREMGIKSQKNNPHLKEMLVQFNQENPENYSKGGKAVHKKHPHQVSEMARKGHKDFRKEDLEGYFRRQKKAGFMASKALKSWKNENSELVREISRKTIRATIDKNPNLPREAGIRSTELQSDRNFTSKPEKRIKDMLPVDFVHNRRFGFFVPDFRSDKRKIIIEVDGVYWHGPVHPQNVIKDAEKDEYYTSRGYRVERIRISQKPDYDEIKLKIKEILVGS